MQGPSLSNTETLEKLDAAVHFFILLQDRNNFYMRSMSRNISESVLVATGKTAPSGFGSYESLYAALTISVEKL